MQPNNMFTLPRQNVPLKIPLDIKLTLLKKNTVSNVAISKWEICPFSFLFGNPLTKLAGRRLVKKEEGMSGLEPEMKLNLFWSIYFTICIHFHMLTEGQTWRGRCLTSLSVLGIRWYFRSHADCFQHFL